MDVGSHALQEVNTRIERLRRDLLASVERQAEIAEELTRFVPEDVRRRIMSSIERTRAHLVAFGESQARRQDDGSGGAGGLSNTHPEVP